jgi:Transposase DDE domain
MEDQLWKGIVRSLREIHKPRRRAKQKFSCEEIVCVWFWAVVHDRPTSWAICRANWPIHERRRRLPSSSTMCRRLRDREVQALIKALEQAVSGSRADKPLVWVIDGKPLVVSGSSGDRQTGFGRAQRGNARGYKLHLIQGINGLIAAWRIAPMNKDERVMARRMVRTAAIQGYLLGDTNYDSNPLHEVCSQHGELQLVAPLRGGQKCESRRPKMSPGRRRAAELFNNPNPRFARDLMAIRDTIERSFANLTNWGGGLTHLPPWVRTHRRVHRWVQAKLILTAIKRALPQTYVAS